MAHGNTIGMIRCAISDVHYAAYFQHISIPNTSVLSTKLRARSCSSKANLIRPTHELETLQQTIVAARVLAAPKLQHADQHGPCGTSTGRAVHHTVGLQDAGSTLTGWAVGSRQEIAPTSYSFRQSQGFMFLILLGVRRRYRAPDCMRVPVVARSNSTALPLTPIVNTWTTAFTTATLIVQHGRVFQTKGNIFFKGKLPPGQCAAEIGFWVTLPSRYIIPPPYSSRQAHSLRQNPNCNSSESSPMHISFGYVKIWQDTLGYGRIQGTGLYSGPCSIIGQVECANIRPQPTVRCSS